MPLTNAQYDALMRGYDARQQENRREAEEKKRIAYDKVPELREIDGSIASRSVAQARRLLRGEEGALDDLRGELSSLRRRREALLRESGFSDGYFEPSYACPDCRDTGFRDGKPCHCFKQASIDIVYESSNLRGVLERENFDTFSLSYYSDEDVSPSTGLSSLETAREAVEKCRCFIGCVEAGGGANLYLYGNTGIGKTFLTHCVARELLDGGFSVIYFTAPQLFDILGRGEFQGDADALEADRHVLDCDLLIIDDLGTELTNSFTNSRLFVCLNERILRGRSTMISTNLEPRELSDRYSERILSRIVNRYDFIKLFGADIRMLSRNSDAAPGGA